MGILNDDPVKYIYILPQQEGYDSSEGSPRIIQDEETVVYRLSATQSFDKTETATVTTSPISQGAAMTDHYRYNDTTISFRGVISNSAASYLEQYDKFTLADKDPETGDVTNSWVIQYIRGIKGLIRGKNTNGDAIGPLVTIYLPDANGEKNCVILSLKVTRDNRVSDGYYVDIVARKLQIPKANTISVVTEPEFREEQKKSETPSNSYETVTIPDAGLS